MTDRTRTLIGVGGVLLAIGVVLGLCQVDESGSSSAVEFGAPTNSDGAVAAASTSLPHRDALSEAGARRAAVQMLELGEDVLQLSPVDAGEVQAAIAAEESRERLRIETASRVQTFRDQLRSDEEVNLQVAAVAARVAEAVLDATPNQAPTARVELWYVGVFTRTNTPPVSFWRTITYELVWQSETWKTVDVASVDGPTPSLSGAVLPADAGELVTVLAGFDDRWLTP